ncbi:MAG: adenylate/guanylate cyclase domain-containing protein, partial [Desulfobacterales bacterium]
YFLDPMEAVKAAIEIQQRSGSYNEGLAIEEQIHVKIGVHYGDGIVEKDDIFGNVVNFAAKIVATLVGDQIYISEALYDKVRSLSAVLFESIDIPNDQPDLEGLKLYRVIWDNAVKFDPATNVLLYLKPLWPLSDRNFKRCWDNLLEKQYDFWGTEIVSRRIISDAFIALILKEESSCLAVARKILAFFESNRNESTGFDFLPLQMVIDTGPYLRAGKLFLEMLEAQWDEMDPGSIYISSAACKHIGKKLSFATTPPVDEAHHHPYYKLLPKETSEKGPDPLFLYQSVMIQGQNPRCYYCGDKRHTTTNCPTKSMVDTDTALKQLGYCSFRAINQYFHRFLLDTDSHGETDTELEHHPDSAQSLARNGFFELKRIHQLRFFQTIWETKEESWETSKTGSESGVKGGMVWMVIDCLRVSNLAKARTVIDRSLKDQPTDYKGHCAKGFLNIENNNLQGALGAFKQALLFARTRVQKMFLLFHVSHILTLQDNTLDAEKRMREIAGLDPSCPEMAYHGIVSEFERGATEKALGALEKFINYHREYFVYALIDPDLAPFNRNVQPLLGQIYNMARTEAQEALPKAERELDRLRLQINETDEAVVSAKSLIADGKDLLKSESYLGYLDILHNATVAISVCSRCLEARKMKIYRMLHALRNRCIEYIGLAANFPFKTLTAGISQRVRSIQTEVDTIENAVRSEVPGILEKSREPIEAYVSEMKELGLRLIQLDRIRNTCIFLYIFIRKGLFLQAINLAITIVLLPVLGHYLVSVFPQLLYYYQHLWSYQKSFMLYAGVFGLLLTIHFTLRDFHRDHR